MRKIVLLISAFVLLVPHAALASGPTIQIGPGFSYTPNSVQDVINSSFNWHNNEPGSGSETPEHTVTSDLDGFGPDSPTLGPGGGYSFSFGMAGTFGYHCTIHGARLMSGTVASPMIASPPTGVSGTTFTITWAVVDIPGGFNMDIQMKKPHKQFKTLFADQTVGQGSNVVELAKKGTYKFRARLQDSASGEKTAYSPALVVTVTAA